MSGAVEDHVRLMVLEYMANTAGIADVGDDRNDLRADPAMAQLAVDFKKIVFGLIEKDQTARAEFHCLPADFRADAAAGAGDDHIFGGEESLKFGCIETDRLTAEEIGQVWIIVGRGTVRAAGLGREGSAVSSIAIWACRYESFIGKMKVKRLDILGRCRTIDGMVGGWWKMIRFWPQIGVIFCLAGCIAHSGPKDAASPPNNSKVAVNVSAPQGPAASDSDPKDTLPYLASDELQGRGLGLPGLDRAAEFIAREFAADGLQPLPGQADFFQSFDYTTQASPGPATEIAIGGKKLNLDTDYLPMRFSAAGKFSGTAVFVGYGVSAPEAGYDDYAGMDVKGKVVIAMRYEPMNENGQSRLAPRDDASGWSEHATFSAKAKTAAEHGAAALLLVNPPDSEPDLLLPFSGAFAAPATIPVLQIKQAVADELLNTGGTPDRQELRKEVLDSLKTHPDGPLVNEQWVPNLKALRDQINASFRPRSISLFSPIVSGTVQIESLTAHVKNVMAVLPGAGPHADEFVVVGAHYDHLGLGTLGHMFGPAGSIYHGADDNASGTATVLELASRFAHALPPARSIIFICFTAEEEGLIGSDYFVKHSPVPLEKMVAMVNLDMVGRIRDQALYIGGQGTAADFDAVLGHADMDSPLRLKSIGRGGLGPSDHMSFARRHVPVMFFFSGIHADYHRPTDTAEKINYEGIGEVADFTAKVIDGLTKMPHDAYVLEADKDSMHLFGSPDFNPGGGKRVILGVIPDYGSQDSRVGVLISGTTPGTPAAAAGMIGGDLLVQFGNQKLENLMDLSEALAKGKPGEKVTVKIIRGNQTLLFDVTLMERKG